MINKLKNICMIIVLGIVGYGICFNISHAISLHQTITYDFDNEEMTNIKDTKKVVEVTINSINQLTEGTFTADELETIQNDFMMVTEMLDEMSLWKLEGKTKLNINDLYLLQKQIYSLPLLPITSLTKIKDQHTNDSYEETLNAILVNSSASAENDFASLQDSYHQEIDLDFTEAQTYLSMYMEYVDYLSKWVLEVGGGSNA